MKKVDKNVHCPFCGQQIEGEIPEGLSIKKIAEIAGRIIKEYQKRSESK